MSREYTYYVREFRTREDLTRFLNQEINDPSCPDEVVSVVLEHGRGWILVGRSPRARVAPGARMSEEMPVKRKETAREAWEPGARGGTDAGHDGRGYAQPTRAYGPGAKHGSESGSGAGGGGERAIDQRGRRGTGRFKMP
jgi:hypothetical protein